MLSVIDTAPRRPTPGEPGEPLRLGLGVVPDSARICLCPLSPRHSQALSVILGYERSRFMTTAEDAAAAFLGKKRIAVTGVSRNPQGHGSNAVYKRLRTAVTRCSPSTPTPPGWRATPATRA